MIVSQVHSAAYTHLPIMQTANIHDHIRHTYSLLRIDGLDILSSLMVLDH